MAFGWETRYCGPLQHLVEHLLHATSRMMVLMGQTITSVTSNVLEYGLRELIVSSVVLNATGLSISSWHGAVGATLRFLL